MKLISTNAALQKTFSNLLRTHQNVAFAVAWASAETQVFKQLLSNSSQITKAIIGIHFYQTHPDVLKAFVGSPSVRFVLQPDGVFHPKMYLFWSSTNWEALVGSANLTTGALTRNSEAMLSISSSDEGSSELKQQLSELVDTYWEQAVQMEERKAEQYRELWATRQRFVRRLASQYGENRPSKTPFESSVMSMSWTQFLSEVKNDAHHGFKERCELLQRAHCAFTNHKNFASMESGIRKTIAGLPNGFDTRWAWFGSMSGLGYFHQAVNNNNIHLSLALDNIPAKGEVARFQYQAYLDEFIQAFPNKGRAIGSATRLLAMKRPDQFVCFDSKNKEKLCKDFGIAQANMNFDRYWVEIIERIMDSPWWNVHRPADKEDGQVWDSRAAMLDAIFYDP